jgi:hypothetical protein
MCGEKNMSDEVCRTFKVDPVIEAHAKDLSLELYQGNGSFIQDWNNYLTSLRNAPNANANEVGLAIAMHCKDPQDVTLDINSKGELTDYHVDTWRLEVNRSVLALDQTPNPSRTISDLQDEIKKLVKPESRDIFIADFNRNVGHYHMPYTAQKNANGEIEIVQKVASK